MPVKVELGNMIVDLLPKRKFEKVRSPMVWALGRIGQRVPLYGPLNTVVPTAGCRELVGVVVAARATPIPRCNWP